MLLERNNMNKFKIDDSVKSIYGFGVVHDISANGSRYLVDDDEGFSWIKEEELELEPCWSCNKIVVNEENAHSAVDEGDYIAFVCAKCGEEE